MRAHCHTESTQAIYHDADIRKLRSDARTDIKTRKIEKNYKRICTNCANKANIQRPSKTAEKRPNATSARYLKESIECLEKKKKKTKRHSTPKTTIARNIHLWHSPQFFLFKKKISKKFREGGRKSKGNINKAGYTATPVACGWAGAVFKATKAFGQWG